MDAASGRQCVEDALAVVGDEPGALAPLEGKVGTGIGWQQMRSHGFMRTLRSNNLCAAETKCAASPGGTI